MSKVPSTTTYVTTPREFAGWLLRSRRGDRAIYFRGVCIVDPLGNRRQMGDLAWEAYEANKVVLFQKAVGLNYDYTAVRA